MGLNRRPQAVPGLLLVGDAVGAVNPFNGEGIAYAIETGEIAAGLIHEALVGDRPAITMQYPRILEDTYGAYFAVGRRFATLIGKPSVMGRATWHLLPHRGIMSFALRAMANLSDGRDGDLQDRLLDLALRVAKAA
jgi:flavin-dependent dehydrogenase